MKIKISVIIPVYNACLTLKECLDSVFNSTFKNYEVIVVSDCSTDNSVQIAKQYKCKIIELPRNRGPAFARNLGIHSAKSNILFFIDSNVVIKKNALTCVNDTFANKKDVNVVQGIYSHKPTYKKITTQYQQSFYCYYTWNKKKKYTTTLTSCCFAIRKKIFIKLKGFNTKIKAATCEDEEFGYNLIDYGNKIQILRKLNVKHRVNYSLGKFIKRTFTMTFETMKSFLRNKSYVKKFKENNYTNVLIGIPLLGLIILTMIIMIFFPNEIVLTFFSVFNIIFLLLHLKFISFVSSTKGPLTAFGIMMICYLDAFLMIIGAGCACISYTFGRKY